MQRINGSLTRDALDRLLVRFDPDPERAAEKYQLLCKQLTKYFECKGCVSPLDLADETVNRVARKIGEEDIPQKAFSKYFYCVARNVFREYSRNPDRKLFPLESLSPSKHPADNPFENEKQKLLRINRERRLECLDSCMKTLSQDSQRLIMSYYEGEERVKIDNRKRLATELGIEINKLRIKIHRIREKLEKCMNECIKKFAGH